MRHLPLSGIVRPLFMDSIDGKHAIVMEGFSGQTLHDFVKTQRPNLLELVEIFTAMAHCLESLHQALLVHRCVQPRVFLYDQKQKELRIYDFRNTTQVMSEMQAPRSPAAIEGSLEYVSPEQTGRMNRSIDYRSDYYSLGITMYEMVTGILPFRNSDPMELLHAHIARRPLPPHKINVSVPVHLSDIIVKLIAKRAEDRYQSVAGLVHDLSRVADSLAGGTHADGLIIGERDATSRFKISEKIIGRDREIKKLYHVFDNACAGTGGAVIVKGEPGIGKSFFINEIQKPLLLKNGIYICGKFEFLQRNLPFSAFIAAFRDLIRQILTESDVVIDGWKKKILFAVGGYGRLLIDVLPELELIIGQQPAVDTQGPVESKNRFNRLFIEFMHAFADRKHPLVLFLDDIQWMDSDSVQLFSALLGQGGQRPLLVIGASRHDDSDDASLLPLVMDVLNRHRDFIEFIELGAFTLDDIRTLISDTLSLPESLTDELSRIAQQKTGGNPFFIKEFLTTLYNNHMIYYDNGWLSDLEEIARANISDNLADHVAMRLGGLSPAILDLLKKGAVIGMTFDNEILSAITGLKEQELTHSLLDVIVQGIIIKAGGSFRFTHDKIHTAIYERIDEQEKKKLHYAVARELATRREANLGHLFALVNHFNLSASLLATSDERCEVARLNFEAGVRAKQATAYEAAYTFFVSGIDLLASDCWDRNYDLALGLYTQSGAACYLVGRHDEAAVYFNEVMARGRSVLDTIPVYEAKISHFIMQLQPEKSLRIGREALGLLGMPMPERPSLTIVIAELLKVKFLVTEKKIQSTLSGGEMDEPSRLAIMRLLMSCAEPSYLAEPHYLPIIISRMVLFSIRHGISKYTSFAFVSYGLLLCGVLNRHDEGCRFGSFAIDLLDKFTDPSLKARVLYIYANMVSLWKNPLQRSFPYLLEAFRCGRESGDHSYAAYAINNYNFMSLFAGERLEEIIAGYSRYYSIVKRFYLPAMTATYELWWQLMINFTADDFSRGIIIGDIASEDLIVPEMIEKKSLNPLAYYSLGKMMLQFFAGEYDGAMTTAIKAADYIDSVTGTMLVPEYHYYRAMIEIALLKKGVRSREGGSLLKQSRKKLKAFSETCPANFTHIYCLVEARYAHYRGRSDKAQRLYEMARAASFQNGYIHDYALACEYSARLYLDRGDSAQAGPMLINARDAYRRWGGAGRVIALENEFSQYLSQGHSMADMGDQYSGRYSFLEAIDLMALIRANQAISMEIVLDKLVERLLKIVIQHSGAERGVLLLVRDEDLCVEAEYRADSDDFILTGSIAAEAYGGFPQSVVHYVRRTLKELVVNRPEDNALFRDDPYFVERGECSLLCIPLIRQKTFKGMMYLENTLNTQVFKHDSIELVKMIATQAAISLENAILFEKSREAEMEKEQQYEEIQAQYEEMETLHEDLEETFHELSETNRKLAREKQQLSTTLRSIAEGVITADQSGRIVLINQGAEEILEIAHRDAEARHLGRIVSLYDGSTGRLLEDPAAKVLRDGEPVDIRSNVYIATPAGEKKYVSVSCSPVKNDSCEIVGIVMVIQDLTEHRRMEDEILKSSKIESLGIFAGGIAHDFNNILTSIVGNLSLLKLQADKGIVDQEMLSDIEKASMRARDLTQQLLTFSRGGAPIKKITSVKDLVVETIDFAMRGSAIKCHFSLGDDLWNIEADQGQISQVIHNLVLNSRQAMKDSGDLWITVQNHVVRPGDHGFISGDYVRIIIRDEGGGIPENIIGRIFDPYFTTKEKGSGLGLAISYSIVKKHGGHIQVQSDGSKGTSFDVFLPATMKEPSREDESAENLVLDGGTILLMDDDDMVLKVGVRLFAQLGFSVDTASNGDEALSRYYDAMKKGSGYDFVVMDLTVPGGMGGREAVSLLRKADPGARIIVSSGYSNDPVMAQYREYGFDGIIVKPYRLSELKIVLYDILRKN